MKTKGVQNAINRLRGARRLGSTTLMAQAEAEAQHALTQGRAWLARADAMHEDGETENQANMRLALGELERTLAEGAAAA